MNFRTEIKGKRITLRKLEATFQCAEMMFAVIDASREHLLPWIAFVPLTNRAEDSYNYLSGAVKAWDAETEFTYMIFADEQYLGNIGINDIQQNNKCAHVGYWLGATAAGHGYMSEALELLEEECFENNNLNKLIIFTDTENKKSANVAIKAGYKLDGIVRARAYSDVMNSYRDHNEFSKLKSEYCKE